MLRAQLQDLWAPPDNYLLEAGTSAELMIAKVRSRHLAGLILTIMAVLIALAAYRVGQRGHREQWLPLALLTFSLIGDPHQAVNSKITFETYFLAIGATCLRYDLRVSVIAGVARWPVDGEDPDDLLHIADARLFPAKALGRNRVVVSSVAAASV